MTEFNLYGVITTCVIGAFLLGIFNEQDDRQDWISNAMIAGVLATLLRLLPSLQKGISINWGICYLLMGVLIINTAVLLGSSFLANQGAQVVEQLRGKVTGNLSDILNSKIWGLMKKMFFGLQKILFIIGVALWAIFTYPIRHPKRLALPQGMGNHLAF